MVNQAAVESAGFGYATYIRMKISGIVDRYARTVCEIDITNFPEDTDQASFVRSVLRSWARDRLLFKKSMPPSKVQLEFIQNFDLEYSQRRLLFVIAGLNWYYRDLLDQAMRGSGRAEEVSERLHACFAEEPVREYLANHGFTPRQYAAKHKTELDKLGGAVQAFLEEKLKDFNVNLYHDLNTFTSEWDGKRRADLFVRYLGFPFWDILLYPVQALADVGERDHVQVVRMSPRDSNLLSKAGEAKLEGIHKGHFGAFFDRAGREKDYLWGRLDAAERLIGMLLGPKQTQEDFEQWCGQAFDAIVAEEKDALPKADDVVKIVEDWRAKRPAPEAAPA
jgi:Protein of unknown function (DUF3376)